jgi:CheY-like chemotaxis protein
MSNSTEGKKRLLAVDDNEDSAALVARIAERCGFEARAVSDAAEIRRALVEWAPDILSLDLSMPDLNGIDLLRFLQESGFAGQLLIISGHDENMRASAARLAAARGLNVAGHFDKPIDMAKLRETLTAIRSAEPK